MASPNLLQDKFLGFQRDPGRDQLPRGYCHDIVNMLPRLGASSRKRGGWSYEGASLTSIYALSGYPRHVGFAPFSITASDQVFAIEDGNNHLIDITNAADRGAAQVSTQAPIFFSGLANELVIIGGNGGDAPKKYDGATIAALGGSPPNAEIFCVYKSRLLATDRTANLGRIYYSGAGNAESWDTTNQWVDTGEPVVGMAALNNTVVIFHKGYVQRLKGDGFPSSANPTPADPIAPEPLFGNVGLYEPNSFATNGDLVVWADRNGVYSSDGSSITDLTLKGGIKTYWIEQVRTADTGSVIRPTIAVGVLRDVATISILDSLGNYVDFLTCELAAPYNWMRHTGIRVKNFALNSVNDEVYFSNQSTKQVGELSTIYLPDETNSSDADTGFVTPVVETAYFDLGVKYKKRTRNVYVGYAFTSDLDAIGTGIDVGFATRPDAETYTEAISLLASDVYTRKRTRISRACNGFSLRLTANAASDFKLYSIEGEGYVQEGSRR